jgi:peroxiredoxin
VPAIESQMMPLGSPAPDFTLPDPSGTAHSLSDAGEAPVVVVAFICNHCPYVKHIAPALAGVSSEMIDRGVAVFGINSNDAAQYPDDSPEQMERESAVLGYRFPYLVDGDQSVARAYGAVCTPDLFVFDRDRNLAYRGQFDSTRPSSGGDRFPSRSSPASAARSSGSPATSRADWAPCQAVGSVADPSPGPSPPR